MVQYTDIPHLLTPIITETTQAVSALKWAVNEMERRYTQMAEEKVKTIIDYNAKMAQKTATVKDEDGNEQQQDNGRMPYIVIIIDEMADLMMQAGKDLEMLIVRIAQKGRAAGIHLVLATQRPEVKVITGLIKANVPGRIAFAVNNNTDSRIMLDMGGGDIDLSGDDLSGSFSGYDNIFHSFLISKVLESAVANATNNFGAKVEDLKVVETYINEGTTLKRSKIASRGSVDRRDKRTSHIYVKVSDGKETE